jgi:flagellar motor switch protein FliM/N
MIPAAAPVLLLGESRRKALTDRVTAALEAWRRDWLPETSAAIRVAIEDVRERPTDIRAHEAYCFRVSCDGESPLVLLVPRRSLAGLVGVPSHGSDASSRFAGQHSLAAALEREALLRLSRCVLGKAPSAQIEVTRMPQGAVDVLREYDAARYICLCVTLGDARCVLDALIAPPLAEQLLPKRPAAPDAERVERRRAVVATSQLVEVDGLLGYAEVTLSDLAELAVGDVIVLQQSLSEPGGIAVHGGERITGAVPGRVDGKRAIQIRGRAA